MSIFKTGSTPFNSVGPFRFHRDPSVRDALDVERRCPATLSAAALGLAPPPQLDVSAAAPLELHRLDVVKTLGDSTYTWMQGDAGSWIKLI